MSRVLIEDRASGELVSLRRHLASLLRPWRVRATVVVLFVLAAASFELVPPFIIRTIVDDHLTTGRPAGLLLLGPPLTLVAGLVAPPLVIVIRYLQVRVRQAERANRIAVGALTARLQESLRGAEVIRAFGREREAVRGFRRVVASVLTASN